MNASIEAMDLQDDRAAPGLLGLAERGLLPDALLRAGIRRMCAQRLREEHALDPDAAARRHSALIAELRQSAVALHVDAANRQHYELPPGFFQACLGPRLKYSGCYYPTGNETLAQAEEAMLALYCERAQLADGQDILELGCGWGSLTLWMAQHYPNARITAVSNSAPQRQFIPARMDDPLSDPGQVEDQPVEDLRPLDGTRKIEQPRQDGIVEIAGGAQRFGQRGQIGPLPYS